MKEKSTSSTKKIVLILLIIVALLVVVVVAITSFFPTFYLKGDAAIEVGEVFDPLSQVSRVRNFNKNDIEITSNIDNKVPGSYEVTYKYLLKTETITVVVEDRDYPVFTIKDNTDYYMSNTFDINSVVVDITDKTGVKDFSWEGDIKVPGPATLNLIASDSYGHTTKNTATVNVIDDVFPELVIKSGDLLVEAGENFDPKEVVEKATDNYLEPTLTYEIVSGSLSKVGTVKAVIYATDSSGNAVSGEVTFKTQDTTAPVVVEKAETHTHKMSEKFDASKYFDITDNTTNTKTTYEVKSGKFDTVGTVKVSVKVTDNYGNTTDAGEISVEVEDDIPPVFALTRTYYVINLGIFFDVDSLIASASDNSGEVKFSYKVNTGTLDHAGQCTVDIIATDKYGNKSVQTAPFTVVDNVAPVLKVRTTEAYKIIGENFNIDDLIVSCTDNDEVASITKNVISGSLDKAGKAVVEIVAIDPSGNKTVQNISVIVKSRVYKDFGTEKKVEITGLENQPYLVAVNRYMGVVTVYGKDENGDYTVPIKAMLCSVGRNSADEAYFGVRSGDGLTPLGVYNTNGKTDYGWGTLFSNDGIHEYVYGQYTTRIIGHILFHSVPYYWQRKDALEWTGTPDNMVHEFNKLGSPASMGCIRLCVRDVEWIWANCPLGTTVVIYDERGNYGPLGRPENFIIDPNSEMLKDIDPEILKLSGSDKNTFKTNPEVSSNPLNWDPTDPDPNNPWIAILEAWEKKQQEADPDKDATGDERE